MDKEIESLEFKKTKKYIYEVLDNSSSEAKLKEDEELAISNLLALLKTCENAGIEPFDFSNMMLMLSDALMLKYYDLDSFVRYGEHLKQRGSDIIRTIGEEWPPVYPKDWPEDYTDKYGSTTNDKPNNNND